MHVRTLVLAFVTAASLVPGVAAQDTDDTNRFSGKWVAKVKDSVVCTIELRAENGVSGSIADCHINADAEGNLIEPEPSDSPSSPTPISNAQIVRNVVTFDVKDDGEEPVKFEMTVVKNSVADLIIKDAPVKINPIRFVRVSSAK